MNRQWQRNVIVADIMIITCDGILETLGTARDAGANSSGSTEKK